MKKKKAQVKQENVAAYEGTYLVEAKTKEKAQNRVTQVNNQTPDSLVLMRVKKQVGHRYMGSGQPRITPRTPRLR
jgi:hypothetical protein